MRQAGLDKQTWDKFWDYWQDLIEEWPDAKKAAMLAAGRALLPAVQRQIKQRVNDARGRVQRWQDMRLGSGGGYVAVSPVDDQVTINQTADRFVTAKDITQYLERGHAIRPPSGRSQRYVPRVRSGRSYVPGRQFYSWTQLDAAKIATEAADEALEWLSDTLDDFNYG